MSTRSEWKPFIELGVAVLAAVVFVRGSLDILDAVVPRLILRDVYGDLNGIFQMGLCVGALVVMGIVIKQFPE